MVKETAGLHFPLSFRFFCFFPFVSCVACLSIVFAFLADSVLLSRCYTTPALLASLQIICVFPFVCFLLSSFPAFLFYFSSLPSLFIFRLDADLFHPVFLVGTIMLSPRFLLRLVQQIT